jgi:hypothetical protein
MNMIKIHNVQLRKCRNEIHHSVIIETELPMKYYGSLYNDMSPLPDGIGGKMLREDGN